MDWAVATAKHCSRLAQRAAATGCVKLAGTLPKDLQICASALFFSHPSLTPRLTAQQSAPISLAPTC
jgi:hypothetical protein